MHYIEIYSHNDKKKYDLDLEFPIHKYKNFKIVFISNYMQPKQLIKQKMKLKQKVKLGNNTTARTLPTGQQSRSPLLYFKCFVPYINSNL